MEVSWKRINDDTRNIIQEFERLYTYNRDFTECERLLTDIFSIYSAKYNIKLDENQNFDHIFHQLLDGIKDVIDSYTPTDLGDQAEAKKISQFFNKMSDDIFKTTEIRGRLREIDPSNLEFRRALEQGIKDAIARQEEIKEQLSSIEEIHKEIFGTKVPNLKPITIAELDDIGHFNIIEQKLNEVQTLKDAIATMTPGVDDSDIQANNDRIAVLEADIEEEKLRIRRTSLVDEARLNSINIADITTSLAETRALRDELDAKAVTDFTELQENLKKVYDKYPNIYALAGMDFSKMDPNTEEGRKAIIEAYGPFEVIHDTLQMDLKIYEKEVSIYENQIRQIDEEEKILSTDAPTEEKIATEIPDDIERRLADDHIYYQKMVEAQMYGNEDYKDAYDFLLSLFKKQIKSNNTFILRNEDGSEILVDDGKGNMVPKTGKYTTIDYDGIQKALDTLKKGKVGDTPTYRRLAAIIPMETTEDVLKFLQLEEYKDKVERDSKIAADDKLAFTEYKNYAAWKNAKTPEEKATAKEALSAEQARDSLYLKTFHYSANEHEFKRQHHATAGKIGETYLPLEQFSRDKTIGENIGVAAHNLYAYTRWQNPFKAKSLLGGAGILLMNTGNIITMVPRMLTKATGLTISKLGYEDDRDPNPYNGRKDARMGARVDYYREQGDGRFKARWKGWMDRTPFRKGRRQETEKEIVDRQVAEIDKSNRESYIAGATVTAATTLEAQKEAIRKNRAIRAHDAKLIAGTQEVQGDIIRDTKDADQKTLSQRVMQRVALEYADVDSSYVSNTGSRNPAENNHRNTQFVKPKEELDGKRKIVKPVPIPPQTKWGRKKGAVVAADPIGRAIRSREIKNTLTRWYAIEEMLLLKGQSALVKWGISKMKETTPTTIREQVATGETELRPTGETELVDTGKTELVENGGHWEQPKTSHEVVVGTREGNAVSNLTMGDLEYTDQAYFEHTASPQFNSVNWIEAPIPENTQAMSLDFRIPDNLSAQDYEALAQIGYEAGDRVCYSIADEATHNLCLAKGRVYASEYIEGMFNFTGDTNIIDAIEQYFPDRVDQALDIILESDAYAGDAGVEFFTDSFSTSHGISSIMEKMNSWGTGWGVETINAEALEAARVVEEIKQFVPDDPVWVKDFIEKAILEERPIFEEVPVYEWVERVEELSDPAKKQLKENLMRLTNGATVLGFGNSTGDLVREAKTKPEPSRERYTGDAR